MKESIQHIFNIQKNNKSKLTISERIEYLKVLKEAILIYEDEIISAAHHDLKKHKIESTISEIIPIITEINLFIKKLRRWAQPDAVKNNLMFSGADAWIMKEPWGQCLIISPWNYPIQLPLLHLVSSVAAGNRTIIKPSELTPHCSQVLYDMISNCFPEEWIAVVEGGADVSEELLKLPFHHIHFTGSPTVGKIVMEAAARNLSSCTLELGGKSPLIIDDKIEISRVIKKVILGKCFNLGQTCIAPDYILIPENRKIEFLETLSLELDEAFGDEVSDHPHLSRIINLKNFKRIQSLYENALLQGAQVYHGGEFIEEDLFISPTIISDIPVESDILNEEIFGPLIPVVTFRKVSEAKEFINARPKPLVMYLFSDDKRWAQYFSKNTSSGALVVNDIFIHILHPSLPFGGANDSGLGYSTGYYGFLSFSHLKPVLRTGVISMTQWMHYPYSKALQLMLPILKKLNL